MAAEMTADEFVDVAMHWTETERTLEEFVEAFGAPAELNFSEDLSSLSGSNGFREVVIVYHCRDQKVDLHLDPESWDAGYVEIVDVGRE